jgi:uncharacterized protein (DUF433 family)
MGLSIVDMPVPLREEPAGTYRIGTSRVTLDVMMSAYKNGSTPEQIVEDFDSLKLSDVYHVIAYYHQNKEAVEAYLEEGERQAEMWQKKIEKEYPNTVLREKLVKAKKAMLAAKQKAV